MQPAFKSFKMESTNNKKWHYEERDVTEFKRHQKFIQIKHG